MYSKIVKISFFAVVAFVVYFDGANAGGSSSCENYQNEYNVLLKSFKAFIEKRANQIIKNANDFAADLANQKLSVAEFNAALNNFLPLVNDYKDTFKQLLALVQALADLTGIPYNQVQDIVFGEANNDLYPLSCIKYITEATNFYNDIGAKVQKILDSLERK